jgi:hypothetical protein
MTGLREKKDNFKIMTSVVDFWWAIQSSGDLGLEKGLKTEVLLCLSPWTGLPLRLSFMLALKPFTQ